MKILLLILTATLLFSSCQRGSDALITDENQVSEVEQPAIEKSNEHGGKGTNEELVFGDEYRQLFTEMSSDISIIKVEDVERIVESQMNIEVDKIINYEVCYGDLYYLFQSKGKAYRLNARSQQIYLDETTSNHFFPLEDAQEVIVTNYYEFIQAIGSNRKIYLLPGNYDLVQYENESYNKFVVKEGKNVNIKNVDNLSIIGRSEDGSKVDFISNDSEASVIAFDGCTNINVENLTFSHSEIFQSCIGITGWIDRCENFTIINCDIYGSGRVGISISDSQKIKVIDSFIYDCSDYEVYLSHCEEVLFLRCIIEDESECQIHTSFTKNIVFEQCYIFGIKDVPIVFCEDEFSYMFPQDTAEYIGYYGENTANLNGYHDYVGDITYEDTWIGKKQVYEDMIPVINSLKEKVDGYVSSRVISNSEQNILSMHFEIDDELNYRKLTGYIKDLTKAYILNPYKKEMSIQFIVNKNYIVSFNSHNSIENWLLDDSKQLDEFAKITISNESIEMIDFMENDQCLTFKEATNCLNDSLIFSEVDADDYTLESIGLGKNWSFYNITIYKQQIRYNFLYEHGEPILGDLYHEWVFADLSVDALSGNVYDNNLKGYNKPIRRPSDELLDYIDTIELVNDDYKFLPEYKSCYILHDDDEQIVLKIVMYKLEQDYGETIYWGHPFIVSIKKDNLGRYDMNTLKQEEIKQYHNMRVYNNQSSTVDQFILLLSNSNIKKGFYYALNSDGKISNIIGLFEDNEYVEMFKDEGELHYNYGKYIVEEGTLITVSFFEGVTKLDELIVDTLDNKYNENEVSRKFVKSALLLSDRDYDYCVIIADNAYKYLGEEIPSNIIFYKVFEQIDSMNLNVNKQVIEEYKKFISELNTQVLDSISIALLKFIELASDDNVDNDEMFRQFRDFYYSVLDEHYYYFMNGKGKINSETRKMFDINGMIIDISESGVYPLEKPGFILENFECYISDGLAKFLRVREMELQQTEGSFIFIDGLLFITWDQLVQRIIEWENFVAKYQDESRYENEIVEAENLIQVYLKIYTNNINIGTFEQMNSNIEGVDNGLKESYRYFIDNHKNSKYHQIIKGYYEILEENGFVFDVRAKEYLSRNSLLAN